MTAPPGTLVLCPEFAFLLHATRWPHDAKAIETIRHAAAAIRDPARLIALARRHHVTGLVARAVGYCEGLADTPLRRELRQEALDLAEEQFRQLLQTRQAVAALRAHDIPVAVLKGAPAALTIYGEVGVRTSIDIDLLIARKDLERAHEVLSQVGYERSEPPCDATARQLGAVSRYGKDWAYDHEHSDTGIELHWRLFQNPRLLGHVGVGDAVDAVVSPGITLPVLPRDLGTLYLTAHGAEHAWSRLKWLADLAAVLRQEPGAADRLVTDAAANGIEHMTMAALLLCHELYAAPLPEKDCTALAQEWRTRKLLDIARASLIGEQDGTELEDRAMATTRKNLGHYLFSSDPRYWWRELTYDLFHDAGADHSRSLAGRVIQRIVNVMRLPSARAAS